VHVIACTIGIGIVHVVVTINGLKTFRLNVYNSYDSCISQHYTVCCYVNGGFIYNRLYLKLYSLWGQSLFMGLSVYQDPWGGSFLGINSPERDDNSL
jgi:hypothetical protein